MNYYAEFNTDKIIREKYFPDFDYKGVFVEVGGATPEFLSMSKHFKDSGWRTIIIEPNPIFHQMHVDAGNEAYKFACSYEDKDDVDFTIVQQKNVPFEGGFVTDHSFSAIAVKEEYLIRTGFKLDSNNTNVIKVSTRRLQTILSDLKLDKIDILSIDVEGWELEVMRGLDTNLVKCEYVVLENLFNNYEYNHYMSSVGFELIEQINHNHVYKFTGA